MNELHTAPGGDICEPVTDLFVLLEDVLLLIEDLHHQGSNTTEIQPLMAHAASLRATLP